MGKPIMRVGAKWDQLLFAVSALEFDVIEALCKIVDGVYHAGVVFAQNTTPSRLFLALLLVRESGAEVNIEREALQDSSVCVVRAVWYPSVVDLKGKEGMPPTLVPGELDVFTAHGLISWLVGPTDKVKLSFVQSPEDTVVEFRDTCYAVTKTSNLCVPTFSAPIPWPPVASSYEHLNLD